MKTLPMEITTLREKLLDDLVEASERVTKAVTEFNAAMEGPLTELQAAIEAYNSLVADAQSLKDDAASHVQDFYDEKSEKWQESEKGQVYSTWIEDLSGLDFPEIEIEFPEPIDNPEYDAIAVMEEQFPLEP